MTPFDAASTLEDVCFVVGDALVRAGIHAVLTGGSAATLYSGGAYQSADADFILRFEGDLSGANAVMIGLGFRANRGQYEHPSTHFTVDFPRGPLAIGDDRVTSHETLHRGGQSLLILSPTDCVRDRLAAVYYWDDQSSLPVAAAVARAQASLVDFALIEAWTEREATRSPAYRQREKYRRFRMLLG